MTFMIACVGQEAALPGLAWKSINRTILPNATCGNCTIFLFDFFFFNTSLSQLTSNTTAWKNRTHVEMWVKKHQAFWSVDHLHFPDKGLTQREPLNLLATAATCMAHVYRRCCRETPKRFIYLQDGWKVWSSDPTESPYHCSPRYWWEMAKRWKARMCVCVCSLCRGTSQGKPKWLFNMGKL